MNLRLGKKINLGGLMEPSSSWAFAQASTTLSG
jgi:hypothetical protein